ncbi:hypothetical protein BGW80DRAFT_1315427 [Lactifluus volemus]|nr:hypothetical protein BGW80DRAFT_1315427 [Lactifluus volemus]
MAIVQDGRPVNLPLALGPILLAALLNAYFFGVVSQQFYIYWTSDFNDSKRVKSFVIAQFVIVILESITLWVIIWDIFIANYGLPSAPQACAWGTFVQSGCQSALLLSANMFLAIRIHSLTKSRLQVGLVITFSTSSFIAGIANIVTTWDAALASSFDATSSLSPTAAFTAIARHVLQVITECLITTFLARALLKSRSGIQKSDSVVNYLIRRVIQIGFLATLWTIAGLVTWFLLPKTSVYTLFAATVGPMYTQVIYDTLLSRVQLRNRMAETSSIVVRFSVVWENLI